MSPAAAPTGPVVACVKPVPLGEPRVERGRLVTEGLAWGLPRGERAVMGAALAAAKALGAEVLALAAGPAAMEEGLREALALGAARGALVVLPEAPDAAAAAVALAAAARREGAPRAVLAGARSADAGQGVVGPMVAELLGLDHVAGLLALEPGPSGLEANRAGPQGLERWRLQPPVVLGIDAAFAPAPHATAWGVGEAPGKPLQRLGPADLGLDVSALAPRAVPTSLARAEAGRGEAEVLEGDADEAAALLARRLRAGGWLA